MTINFANEASIHARAAGIAAPLPLAVRDRCTRLIALHLRSEPCNARTLTARELAKAPRWAQQLADAGAPPVWFNADPNCVARLRRLVKRIVAAHAELTSIAPDARGLAAAQRQDCLRLFDGLAHMNFQTLDAKSRQISARRRRLNTAREAAALASVQHFVEEFCTAGVGRRWRRLVSTGALGAAGKRMDNCTSHARSTHEYYAGLLRRDEAQFWVLENHRGDLLAMAMFATASRRLLEAKAPRNAVLSAAVSADLEALARAKDYEIVRRRPALERPAQEDRLLLRRLRAMLATPIDAMRRAMQDGDNVLRA